MISVVSPYMILNNLVLGTLFYLEYSLILGTSLLMIAGIFEGRADA